MASALLQRLYLRPQLPYFRRFLFHYSKLFHQPNYVDTAATLQLYVPRRCLRKGTRDRKQQIAMSNKLSKQIKDDNTGDVDEEEDEETLEDDGTIYEEDKLAPLKFKEMRIYVSGVRVDSVLSAGLNVSRHEVQEDFYRGKVLINGERGTKKGETLKEGDYVDWVKERNADAKVIKVQRVRLLSVKPHLFSAKQKIPVRLRVWAKPFDLPDQYGLYLD